MPRGNPLYNETRFLKAGQNVQRMLTNYNTGKQRYYQLALVQRLLHCRWDDFGGTARGTGSDAPPAGGVVESGSHGFVHVSAGGDASRYDKLACSGDMAILNTAARDPIFYAHHANLDRLWNSWETFGTNKNPSDPAWRNLAWSFFDEHGTWTSMSVAQMADMEHALGYRYESKITAPPQMLRGVNIPQPKTAAMPRAERRIDLLGHAPLRANARGAAPLLANPAPLANAAEGEIVLGGLVVADRG
jgi:hypothetical protein